MNRRQTLKFMVGAAAFANLSGRDVALAQDQAAAFTLPPLGYPFEALEPHIDAMTMRIHHGNHHAAYVNNLNGLVEPMAGACQEADRGNALRSLSRPRRGCAPRSATTSAVIGTTRSSGS